MPPTVSVIVPNYNHARYLRARVDSILGQTYQDFELILLDDYSTDGSREILASFASNPVVRISFNESNSGTPFKQWNKGVRMSCGQYVWIAESDDYADERFLERLVAILEADPATGFVYCRSWQISENNALEGLADGYLEQFGGDRWKHSFQANGTEECRQYFVRTNPVPNASAVIFRKACYEKVGGADEGLRMCGDWKLWAAMALEGNLAYSSEPLNYYRTHGGNVRSASKRTGQDVAEALQVIQWLLGRVIPPNDVLEKMRKVTSYYWVPAMLDSSVPLRTKRLILRSAKAVDPNAVKKLIRHALTPVRLKLAKEWGTVRKRISGRART